MKTKLALLASVAFASIQSQAAMAAGIDVTSTVTAIGDALVPIGLIGAAVLGVVVALKAFHWVRRAF